MVIVESFKDKVINLIDGVLSTGELGTSSIPPTINDTDLLIGNASTKDTVSGSVSSKQLLISYNINSVVGNGYSYAEYGNFLDDNTMINRVVFASLPKTSSIEIQITTVLQII